MNILIPGAFEIFKQIRVLRWNGGQKSIQAEKEEEGKKVDKRTKGDDQEENEGGKDNIKFRRKFRRKKETNQKVHIW